MGWRSDPCCRLDLRRSQQPAPPHKATGADVSVRNCQPGGQRISRLCSGGSAHADRRAVGCDLVVLNRQVRLLAAAAGAIVEAAQQVLLERQRCRCRRAEAHKGGAASAARATVEAAGVAPHRFGHFSGGWASHRPPRRPRAALSERTRRGRTPIYFAAVGKQALTQIHAHCNAMQGHARRWAPGEPRELAGLQVAPRTAATWPPQQ